MPHAPVIQLSIPGRPEFCDVARRVVMEACKLVGSHYRQAPGDPVELSDRYEFEDRFTLEFISAFSEIFNNVTLHAYEGEEDGIIQFKIDIGQDRLVVEITDTGKSFDIDAVPLPDELPTGGMGIFIARSMLDGLDYEPGPPNCWRLEKSRTAAEAEN